MALARKLDPRVILSVPAVYNLFSRMMAGNARQEFVHTYVKPKENDKILDIGCGPGNVLGCIPFPVDYTGVDVDQNYITHAAKEYGNKGRFLCQFANRTTFPESDVYDIVIASGLIHHLTDDAARELFETAHHVLKKGGRLVTLDGCYVDGQNPIARMILSRDRGQHVRTQDAYEKIARGVFADVKTNIHHKLSRFPYTYIIMECTK